MAKIMENRSANLLHDKKLLSWLAETPEEPLEEELEIVDAHHHIWDMRELKGYNLFGIFKQQLYMTDELIDDFVGGGHNVIGSVYVTAHAFFQKDPEPAYMAPLGEVQFVQGIAAQFASGKYGENLRVASGIVGSADLATYGAELEPLLVACKAASPNYRGIRCTGAHDPKVKNAPTHPTPGLYADAKFREGFALLEKHGLLFDAWVFSSQLPEVADLAKAFPNTTIVLNHAGTPIAGLGNYSGAPEYDGKQAEILRSWKQSMQAIVECPNVFVKIGGLVLPYVGSGMESLDKPVGSEDLASKVREAFTFVVQAFGPQRCIFVIVG